MTSNASQSSFSTTATPCARVYAINLAWLVSRRLPIQKRWIEGPYVDVREPVPLRMMIPCSLPSPIEGAWLVPATNPLFLYTYALNSNIVIHGPRPT
jgi:hypothetical protein